MMTVRDRDEGLDELFRQHHQRVVRLAFLLTQDTGIAEEIAQEAFVRVWQAWDRVQDGPAFLRTTAVNLAKSSLRRRALETRHRFKRGEDAVHVDPSTRIDAIRALERLPMRQRMCVALRFYEDLSESDTAAVMGISVGAVKSQTFKALQRLGSILGGEA
jgi:RNA polymerase sigma-70 factor (sigma-E family)